ncbi:GNAT family N-acetyltransferase [Paenibacillus sp. J22TS3]|uniref:GNAT family N-acetyltransferase n=1 Tax=Paenibacillus sp. J22TS3 TaxID=2807192 RepID=UPI001BD173C4|nr:GNAT family N-acetyltransferase [Paenibacillus sp. J22TS3]
MLHIRSSLELIQEIEQSEIRYMSDRMSAIQGRPGNPEGIEIQQFGQAVCYYSRSMPWGSFNTVKGITGAEVELIDSILEFYQARERNIQLEIVPGLADQEILKRLYDHGLYPAGYHTSLYMNPADLTGLHENPRIRVEELTEDQFDLYAAIHCRSFGLPEEGIPPVAANNIVLYPRPGWKFYLAYMDEIPAAAGVMYIKGDVASLTLAATLPEFRNQGLQGSLLRARIREAARSGCRLVVGQCAFLSQSHRNMEQSGMKVGYIRTTWIKR